MVLLLVDDQQSVLDGILAGVDWKALGSPEVLTANSALQAKRMVPGAGRGYPGLRY